jgi:hypothetical protein
MLEVDESKRHAKWKEVYITHRSHAQNEIAFVSKIIPSADSALNSPFRFYHLAQQKNSKARWRQCNEVDVPWAGDPPVILRWQDPTPLYLCLGTCTRGLEPHSGTPGLHWANIAFEKPNSDAEIRRVPLDMHDCSTDHIRDWPLHAKSFHFSPREVGLSYCSFQLVFLSCPMNPANTFVVHVRKLDVEDHCRGTLQAMHAELACEVDFIHQWLTNAAGLNQRDSYGKHRYSGVGHASHEFGNLTKSVRTSLGVVISKAHKNSCPAGGSG